jgi:hypothetical protein
MDIGIIYTAAEGRNASNRHMPDAAVPRQTGTGENKVLNNMKSSCGMILTIVK